ATQAEDLRPTWGRLHTRREGTGRGVGREFVLPRPEGGAPQRVVREPDTPLATPVAFPPMEPGWPPDAPSPRMGRGDTCVRATDPVACCCWSQTRAGRHTGTAVPVPTGFRSFPLEEKEIMMSRRIVPGTFWVGILACALMMMLLAGTMRASSPPSLPYVK